MTGVGESVANLLGFLKELFGFKTEELKQKNTEEMKRAEVAKREASEKDQTRRNIAEGNLDELRKVIAE